MYLGIDFGTTNTAVAIADDAGDVTVAVFPIEGETTSSFRSVLCFADDSETGRRHIHTSAGPQAIADYLDYGNQSRLIQSIKTYLSSTAFNETSIFGTTYTVDGLIAIILRHLRIACEASLPLLPTRVVAGRPVRFAGERADDDLAVRRLRSAFETAGFEQPSFALEPLAAAYFYARHLDRAEICLVADFGGGTSDFSVVQFEPGDGVPRTTPLAHAGVGVAGDSFDYRIIQHIVCPRLGENTYYRSFDKRLKLPRHYYAKFERWHHLSHLRNPRTVRDIRAIRRTSEQPRMLDDLLYVIEEELGFHLYQAVSRTKVQLSSSDEALFAFVHPPVEMEILVTRNEFESWIEDDLAAIGNALDEVLTKAGVAPGAISRVFMTGGTSLVPAVRRQFETRFGVERLMYGDEFLSVAAGLALIHRSSVLESHHVNSPGA